MTTEPSPCTTKGDFKLTIEPATSFEFPPPNAGESKIAMKLTNGEDKPRAYKVKCTSNSLFKIRPAVGWLDKGASTTVTLTCKVLEEGSVPADNYHLFSIYHIDGADGQESEARKIWTNHKGDADASKRIPVLFPGKKKDGEKIDEKKEEKKEDKKEEEEKKEDKKEEEEKKEDKKEEEKKE